MLHTSHSLIFEPAPGLGGSSSVSLILAADMLCWETSITNLSHLWRACLRRHILPVQASTKSAVTIGIIISTQVFSSEDMSATRTQGHKIHRNSDIQLRFKQWNYGFSYASSDLMMRWKKNCRGRMGEDCALKIFTAYKKAFICRAE